MANRFQQTIESNYKFFAVLIFSNVLTSIRCDPSCVLPTEKYDFNLLNWYPWNVTVKSENSKESNTYYQLNLCHPLADSPCAGGASICRIRGSSIHTIAYQTANPKINPNLKLEDGFWLEYFGADCSKQKKFRTLINFYCGSSLGSPELLFASECETYFIWKTSVACVTKPLRKEIPCYIYDKNDKKRDLSPLILKTGAYHVKSGITAIDFYINVCSNIITDHETDSCSSESSACRKIENQKISFGKPSLPLTFDSEGNLMLKYTADSSLDIPTGCTLQPQTTITFICPHKDKDKNLYSQFLGPILTNTDNCQYETEWVTEYACPLENIISQNCLMIEEEHGISIDLNVLTKKINDPPYFVNASINGEDFYFYLNPCGSLPTSLNCRNSELLDNAVCMKSKSDQIGTSLGSKNQEELRFTDEELTLTYNHGDACPSDPLMHLTTVIIFECDTSTVLGHPTFNKNFSCTYFFNWKTHLACAEMAPGFQCQAHSGMQIADLSSLTKHNGSSMWDVFTDTVPAYQDSQIILNICGPLYTNNRFRNCPIGSAACLIGPNKAVQSLGRFGSIPQFIDRQRIELKYTNGSSCSVSPFKAISTTVKFICKPGETDSGPILSRVSADNCSFDIEWTTAAACIQSLHVGSNCHVYNKELDFDFDLSPLQRPDHYQISNHDYDFFINVCGESIGTPCNSLGELAVCQVKKSNRSMIWSLGLPNDKLQYYNGFINLSYTDGTPYKTASKSPRETMISFLCDPEAGHGYPEFIEEMGRVYSFRWYTSLACPEQLIECSAFNENTLQNFDLSSLTKTSSQPNWEVLFSINGKQKIMYINVCRQLTKTSGCDSSAAACLLDATESKDVINAGRMSHRPKFISNILTLEYTMGDTCEQFGDNSTYKTYIHFICPGDENKSESLQFSHVIAKCEYVFIWQTVAACALKEIQSTNKCFLTDPTSGNIYDLQPVKNIYFVSSAVDKKFQTFTVGLCGATVHCGEKPVENVAVCGIDSDGRSSVLGLANTVSLHLSHHDRLTVMYQGKQNLTSGKPSSIVEILLQCSRIKQGKMKFIKNDNEHYIFHMESVVACPPPPQECSVIHKGRLYDLSALSLHNSYWEVEDVRPDHHDLRYYINICSPLKNLNFSNCIDGNIGACQISLSSNNSYSLGIVHNQPQIHGNGEPTLIYEDGSPCHGNKFHRSIRIEFHCSSIQKSPKFIDETPECEYIVSWETPVACPIQKIIGHHCQVDDPLFGYYFDLTPLKALSPITVQGGEYTYKLGICSQVHCGSNKEVGVCQIKGDAFINAGIYNEHVIYNNGELSLTYTEGQDLCHGKFNRSTKIVLTCDPHTIGKPVFLNESAECSYLFLWETSLACTPSSLVECTTRNSAGKLFDLSPLTLAKDSHEYNTPDRKLKFLINVCHSIPLSSDSLCDYSSGICLSNSTDLTFINLGNVQKKPYFENEILKLKYESGDNCNSSVKYQSIISFHCDQSKLESEPVFLMQDDCTWYFLWDSAAACPLEEHEDFFDDCTAINTHTGFRFNLTSLWKPSGYTFSDDSEHLYTINVCGNVINSPCEFETGCCQWKQNGSEKYNLGIGNTRLHFHNGVLSLNYSDGSICDQNGLSNTIINFACSQSAGIGKPLYVDKSDKCTYFVVWHTSLACEKHVHCKIDAGSHVIDLTPLMRYHEPYIAPNDNLDDIYLINVCRPLNPSPHVLCPPEAAVCKFRLSGDEPLSLGQVENPPFIDANNNIVLEYFDGSWCPKNTSVQLYSRIIFLCKEGDDLGYPELVNIMNDCQYIFEWMTNIACENPSIKLTRLGPNSYIFINSTSQTVFDLSLADGLSSTSKNDQKEHVNFSLSDTSKVSSCGLGTALCRKSLSLGSISSVKAVYEESVLKLKFQEGDKCSATTSWSSEIWFICDFHEELGSPILVEEYPCHAYYHWKTSLVCTTRAAECTVFDENKHLLDFRILSSHSHGWNMTDSTNNTYWINLCHSLPDVLPMRERCSESTICLRTSDGVFYSLGRLDSQHFQIDKDGIIILSYNGTSVPKLCSSGQRVKSSIFLKCGEGRGEPTLIGNENCHYKFEWITFAACPNTRKKDQLTFYKDVIQNEAQNIKLNVSSWMKQIFTVEEDRNINRKYKYEIVLDSQSDFLTSCGISGVCQREVGSDFHRIIGTLNNPELYQTNNGFDMILSSESPCGRNLKRNASTVITFQCSSEKTDNLNFIYESLDCVYIFSWRSQMVCPLFSQTSHAKIHVHRHISSQQNLSTGTVFTLVGFIIGIILLLIIIVNKQDCRNSVSYRLGLLWRKTRHGPAYRYSAIPQSLDGSTERTFLLRQENVHPIQAFQEDSDDEVLQI